MAGDGGTNILGGSPGGLTGEHAAAGPNVIRVGPATSDEWNGITLPLIPIACWAIHEIRFAFDTSFVTADCSGGGDEPDDIRLEMANLADLVQKNPGCPLSLFGHADPVGSDTYNKALSERRAKAIYALCIFNTDSSSAVSLWQSIAKDENWGANQRGVMQTFTGLPAGTDDSTLMQAHMQKLASTGPKLGRTDFLAQGADTSGKGDFQGCSEFNPLLIFSKERQATFDQAKANNDAAGIALRNSENAPNRRVLGLLFKKGSKVDPDKWPCPRASEGIAGCTARFFPDGETRRSTHLSGTDRRMADTHDNFACRFYHRLAATSPCENEPVACWKKDFEQKVSGDALKRYWREWKMEGGEYGADERALKFSLKLLEPISTGDNITLECRFKANPLKGVTPDQIDETKQKLLSGVADQWNDVFTLIVDDPVCGKKEFPILYQPIWVDSGQNITVNIHTNFDREEVDTEAHIMHVSVDTDNWTYAHEFGHCISLPDEYGYRKKKIDTLKYIKPDGTLTDEIFLPFNGKGPKFEDHTLMSTLNCTTMQPRLAFHIAIEVQKLLRAKLGRLIVCSIADLDPDDPDDPDDNDEDTPDDSK